MLLIILSLVSSALAGPVLLSDTSYDYFLFETEWKPTNCKFMNCPSAYIGEAFNIHGLWPERKDGNYPSNCSNAPFGVSSSLEAELNKYWESYNGDNPDFWLHEWSKHGTCVSPAESCEAYLGSVVNLFLAVDPQGLLATHHITPSNSVSYSVSAFLEAFATDVNITCKCSNNVCYFEKLEMCVDKNLGLMNCTRKSTNCGTMLILPVS
jgi:ribonuclease I